MIFSEYVTAVALRMRESEALAQTRITSQAPYFVASDLEQIVYEALTQTLYEVPNADYEGFTSDAVQTFTTNVASGFTGISAIAAPQNIARVIGVSIGGDPSVGSTPKAFVQAMNMTGGRWTNRWTMIDGKFLYIGLDAAIFTVLVEPSLAQWKAAGNPIFPPGYDIRAVDLAHKRILIADYVPAWRP